MYGIRQVRRRAVETLDNQMSSDEIKRLVAEEIDGDWERTNLHNCVLRKCLVDPRKVNVSFEHPDNSLEVWLVLEEKPTEIEGYIVFFDERESRFGLAYRSNPHRMVSVGHYGSFLEAFDGM